MKDLLRAMDELIAAQDLYDRQHTEQARKIKDRKRQVWNHERAKIHKAEQEAEKQAALFVAEQS